MGLNIRIHDINVPSSFELFYKTGNTPGNMTVIENGYTQFGGIYPSSSSRNYNTNPVVFTGATFNTQYWFKIQYTGVTGQENSVGYIIENIKTHQPVGHIYYALHCCDFSGGTAEFYTGCTFSGGTVVYGVSLNPTPAPTSTPAATPLPTPDPTATTPGATPDPTATTPDATPNPTNTQTPTPTGTEGTTPNPTATNTPTPTPTPNVCNEYRIENNTETSIGVSWYDCSGVLQSYPNLGSEQQTTFCSNLSYGPIEYSNGSLFDLGLCPTPTQTQTPTPTPTGEMGQCYSFLVPSTYNTSGYGLRIQLPGQTIQNVPFNGLLSEVGTGPNYDIIYSVCSIISPSYVNISTGVATTTPEEILSTGPNGSCSSHVDCFSTIPDATPNPTATNTPTPTPTQTAVPGSSCIIWSESTAYGLSDGCGGNQRSQTTLTIELLNGSGNPINATETITVSFDATYSNELGTESTTISASITPNNSSGVTTYSPQTYELGPYSGQCTPESTTRDNNTPTITGSNGGTYTVCIT